MATPWFPMYPTDFLVSTATMSPVQGWAYTQLLMYAWTNGGIPDDREQCAALTRCPLTEADWAILRSRFEPMATPMATLCNPRMERERVRVQERHESAAEAGRRGAKARWGRENGVANGNPNGNPNGKKIATTTTTTTTNNHTPKPPQGGVGGERVEFSISDTNLLRLVKRDPAWRTRIERAEAGDWYEGGQEVKPEAIIAQAMAVVRDKLHAEHDEVMDRVTAKGLPEPLAARLWASWLSDHLGGRPSPRSLLMASLADSSIRNHAAVWRAQLGYSDAHGEAQGTSAAGGNG
jgi:uncharacterized protein YdaU (DUF1376 family)